LAFGVLLGVLLAGCAFEPAVRRSRIATGSFSLLGKGAIIVGGGGAILLLRTQWRAAPPPPAAAAPPVCRPKADRTACVLASGTCPGTTSCGVTAREGLDVISCACQ
jgi:hypothetical protein